MMMFLFLIALQGISGGISGYITNKYAVNMLFKEYTPLKLGGVIKKKKEKFIEEISELVERDIINSETLKAEMADKDFNSYIEQISASFFEKALKESLGNAKIGEIFGFSESMTKIEEFIRKNMNDILPELLVNIFTKINLEDILTDEQISKIAESGYDLLMDEFEKNIEINDFVLDLYKENSNVSMSNIISEEVQRKLNYNVNEYIIKIVNENIFKDEKSCEIFFDKILKNINIDEILAKLQTIINNSNVDKFISESEKEEITSKIYIKINEGIKDEKVRNLILTFINELNYIGKDSEFTVCDVLPNEMEERLTSFLKTAIPKVMPYISEWISDNKIYLDEMIEESVDEAIDGMDESIKKLVVSKVRNALICDTSSDDNIVSKIVSYFKNNFNDDSYEEIVNVIIEYLKTAKIKDILNLLEKQEFFSLEKAADLIIKQFDLDGKNILDAIIRDQFSKKIDSFIKIDLVELFNSHLKTRLYRGIFQSQNRFTLKINNIINEFVTNKSNELFNKKLSELCAYEQVYNLSNNSKEFISKLFRHNERSYKEKMTIFITSQVGNINLSTMEKYKEDISEYIVDKIIGFCKESVDKNKQCEVSEIVKELFDKKQLTNIIINEGYPLLITKMPDILDGKIEKFAKDNLSKYDEDEICNIVQDFMGNQLKPLSVFGAILGTGVGVIYQLIFPNSIGAYGFPGSVINIIMSCGIMAGIGYITNVIALWMIFHPYKENKIVSKIPFFKKFALGYIPAHKNQFAIGIAKLIDEELLNKEEINKSFNLHKDNINSALMKLVTNNNYQLLVDFIRNKKKALAKFVYTEILKYCGNTDQISEKISFSIGENKINKLIKKHKILNLVPELIGSIKNMKNNLAETVQHKLQNKNTINDILPREMSGEIRRNIKIQIEEAIKEKIMDTLHIDFISMIVSGYEKDYNLLINKTVKDLAGDRYLNTIKNNFGVKIYSYISGDVKEYITNYIRVFLHNELHGENNIGSIFNGKVKSIIDDNINTLTKHITSKALLYLKNNQDNLALIVQDSVKENLNFFEKIAYSSFGGDDIAYKVVEIMLNKKLPVMMEVERDRLIDVAKTTLNESIYTMKISTLRIKADEINIVMIIDNVFNQFNQSIKIRDCISNSSGFIIDALTSVPIIEYLELCDLHKLDLVCKKFDNEINIIKENLYRNIKDNREILSKAAGQFLDEKIIGYLFNSNILDGITFEDINNSIDNILDLIISSKETRKHLAKFLESAYDNTLSELSAKEIIDIDILNIGINKVISYIFNDEEFNENNLKIIDSIIQNATDNNLDFISDDTKKYLIDKTMQTGLISISDYIIPVLQEINLKNITNKQIELLNPEEIDILFNSFAGDFFTKLRIYGVFGFVFGVNVWLSIILLALDIRYDQKTKISCILGCLISL